MKFENQFRFHHEFKVEEEKKSEENKAESVREFKPWHEVSGCWIQGEYLNNQLDGRAIAVMPGCFILAAMFTSNTPGKHFLLEIQDGLDASL